VAAAMRELLANPLLARRLAECGRQTVAEKFSLDRMVRDTVRLYRQVLSC
jgi:glycosyltransferase involved in cell wall biosynthesis